LLKSVIEEGLDPMLADARLSPTVGQRDEWEYGVEASSWDVSDSFRSDVFGVTVFEVTGAPGHFASAPAPTSSTRGFRSAELRQKQCEGSGRQGRCLLGARANQRAGVVISSKSPVTSQETSLQSSSPPPFQHQVRYRSCFPGSKTRGPKTKCVVMPAGRVPPRQIELGRSLHPRAPLERNAGSSHPVPVNAPSLSTVRPSSAKSDAKRDQAQGELSTVRDQAHRESSPSRIKPVR